jgi:hypothetical protein
MLIHCGKPSATLGGGPGSLPQVDERGGRGRQVMKSHLPALIVGWRSDSHGSFLGLVLFRLVAPRLHPRVVGSFFGTGCMVPQPFVNGGNQLHLEFWAVTGDLRYLGYFTLPVAPEPSIEWVARIGHSTVGRTCSCMVLWALSHDSMVKL